MSHFAVLVIGDNPEEQLKPFDENLEVAPYKERLAHDPREAVARYIRNLDKARRDEWRALTFEEASKRYYGQPAGKDEQGWYVMTTYNPNSKWDWYQIGGRWTRELLKLKSREAAHLVGSPGLGSNGGREGYADVIRKRDVDWEGMAHEAAEEAGRAWDAAHAILDQYPRPHFWSEYLDAIDNGRMAEDAAREEYHAQPAVQAILQHPMGWPSALQEAYESRDRYCAKAAMLAGVTYAVLKDGQWYERSTEGRFGTNERGVTETEWAQVFAELVGSAPDDAVLTVVDCHI